MSDPSIPNSVAPSDSYGRRERLDRILGRVSDSPLRFGNGLQLLRNGPATFEDWLWAIANAERWVHLENYIFRADETGHRFAEALSERARAGVKVRVLVDWFGCLSVPNAFWNGMRESGVEVRMANAPTLRGPLLDLSRRDHRKLLAVDGTYASTGGICIGSEWMDRSPDTGLPYRDTAVSVRGPAVADLERAFAGVWDDSGSSLPAEERPDAHRMPAAGETPARVVIQEPRRMRVLRTLQMLCAGVERRLWIADAYFLSIPVLTESLKSAANDGVDVRILVPATNDLPWIGALSRTGYRDLLDAGVNIFEYSGLMMHAKTTVADGWWSRVGSTNLNVSGLMANWEIDLVAEDQDFGAQMEEMFEEDLADAREVRLVSKRSRQRPEPDRRISRAERRIQRESQDSGSRAAATLTRVGTVALRKSEEPVATHERALGGALGGGLLVAALLGGRFPKVLSWPLSAVAAVLGLSALIRAARSPSEEALERDVWVEEEDGRER